MPITANSTESDILTSWQNKSDLYLESAPHDKTSTLGYFKATVDLDDILEEQ